MAAMNTACYLPSYGSIENLYIHIYTLFPLTMYTHKVNIQLVINDDIKYNLSTSPSDKQNAQKHQEAYRYKNQFAV